MQLTFKHSEIMVMVLPVNVRSNIVVCQVKFKKYFPAKSKLLSQSIINLKLTVSFGTEIPMASLILNRAL